MKTWQEHVEAAEAALEKVGPGIRMYPEHRVAHVRRADAHIRLAELLAAQEAPDPEPPVFNITVHGAVDVEAFKKMLHEQAEIMITRLRTSRSL